MNQAVATSTRGLGAPSAPSAAAAPLSSPPDVPRVVWFYWRQGLESAAPLVQMCFRSWQEQNPGWEIRLVDAASEAEWVDLPAWADRLGVQQYSDLLRLHLLERHGGVWVDATTFCNQPLLTWLPGAARSGFFAFSRPTAGQSLDVWFLAAQPHHPVVAATRRFLEDYFRTSPSLEIGPLRTLVRKAVYQIISRSVRTSEWWFSRPVRLGLGLAPYYATAYAFNRTLRTDAEARRAWLRTPQISADGPHALWSHGLDRAPDDDLLREFAAPSAPLYKLSWRHPAADDPRTALGHFVADRRAAEVGL